MKATLPVQKEAQEICEEIAEEYPEFTDDEWLFFWQKKVQLRQFGDKSYLSAVQLTRLRAFLRRHRNKRTVSYVSKSR